MTTRLPGTPSSSSGWLLARRLGALVDDRIREKERLHAARRGNPGSAYVVNDLEVIIRHLERRIGTYNGASY